MYMHMFDTMLFVNVCISMKSNHLSNMGVSKFVKHWRSHKKMSISILLRPLKRQCIPIHLKLCQFSIHPTTHQPYKKKKVISLLQIYAKQESTSTSTYQMTGISNNFKICHKCCNASSFKGIVWQCGILMDKDCWFCL